MCDMKTPNMSFDEMIDTLKGLVFGTFDRTTSKEREALDLAISKLEHNDSVIEDIRAEIEKQYNWLQSTGRALYDVDIAFDAIRKAIDSHI